MDNLFVERLWRSIKYEEVYLRAYTGGKDARAGIEEYFRFYNTQRPHQALGYRTPAEVFMSCKQLDHQRDVVQSQEPLTFMEGVEAASPDLNLASTLSE